MAKLEMYNGHYLWHYIPSFPAAVVFIALFGLLTAGHAFKLVRHRTWFCIPFVVGGGFETVGYVGRALAHDKTGKLIPHVLQSTLLLLAPILFAASLYMTLSRVIRAVGGQSCSMIAPRWLTTVFVFSDVFSFIVQASGAGLRVQAG
ncbi:RTA1 like protein-domain-containing protein, partial [Ilyonectria robusta]|uniref:RTA1 like protein-domain-containing protein n=1 Tax=Ilyonectria robusta TaxID=1079257 RepID=UPI001E8CC1A3